MICYDLNLALNSVLRYRLCQADSTLYAEPLPLGEASIAEDVDKNIRRCHMRYRRAEQPVQISVGFS